MWHTKNRMKEIQKTFERKISIENLRYKKKKKNDNKDEIRNNKESENLSDEATIIGTLKSVTISRVDYVWR